MQADKLSSSASQMHKEEELQRTAPILGNEAMQPPTKRSKRGASSLMQDLMREELAMHSKKKA